MEQMSLVAIAKYFSVYRQKLKKALEEHEEKIESEKDEKVKAELIAERDYIIVENLERVKQIEDLVLKIRLDEIGQRSENGLLAQLENEER